MFVAMVDIVLKDEKKDDFKSWITESNQVLSKFDGFVAWGNFSLIEKL